MKLFNFNSLLRSAGAKQVENREFVYRPTRVEEEGRLTGKKQKHFDMNIK